MPKAKFIICLLIISIISVNWVQANDRNYNVNLQIINSKNRQITLFKVNIADTPKERETGLMFIKKLPENHAMLFEFENRQVINMWMKNTKIPLDMIFIKDNQIASIRRNNVPESLKIISSIEKVDQVLEINGGLSKKLNINVGDKITRLSP
jgi:uncharacterized membrane protein (UPF0127 family)